MILIAEKINTINKKVAEALEKKDVDFFRNMATSQTESGRVDAVDINVGSDISKEPHNMKWAVSVVEETLDGRVPLSIDSPNPETIIAGFDAMKEKKGSYINSVTLQGEKYKELLPLAKEHDLNIIAMPIGQKQIPSTADKRYKNSYIISEIINDYGIPLERLYLDCLVTPISISKDNAKISLDTLKLIKKNITQARTIICIASISFGLPGKSVLNSIFLSLLAQEGLDAVLMDPFDKGVMGAIHALDVLQGKDEYCINYLKYAGRK